MRFERLKQVRRSLADEQNWPAFCVFHNTTLREIARVAPASLASLAAIKGVGANKAEKYGLAVLAALKSE